MSSREPRPAPTLATPCLTRREAMQQATRIASVAMGLTGYLAATSQWLPVDETSSSLALPDNVVLLTAAGVAHDEFEHYFQEQSLIDW